MKELLVMVPGSPWDGNRVGQHHLAVHLSQRIPVLWVDPPISYGDVTLPGPVADRARAA